jgi:hypothetical protein
MSSGSLTPGTLISGPNITAGTVITEFGENTTGTVGTYTVNNSQTVAEVASCTSMDISSHQAIMWIPIQHSHYIYLVFFQVF